MSVRPMNAFGRMVLAVTLAVGLVGGQAAQAAAVESQASLDWSAFTWTFTGTDILFSDPFDVSEATVGSTGVPVEDFAFDWTTGTLATATNALGTATASTNTTQVVADVLTDPQEVSAFATRLALFTAVGSGTVQFSVPYSLGLTYSQGAAPALLAEPFVFLAATEPFGGPIQALDFDIISVSPSGGGDTFTRNGTLVINLDLADEQILDLVASAEVTVVPLPAPVWLFGSAMFALGFIGRRKSRAGGISESRDA